MRLHFKKIVTSQRCAGLAKGSTVKLLFTSSSRSVCDCWRCNEHTLAMRLYLANPISPNDPKGQRQRHFDDCAQDPTCMVGSLTNCPWMSPTTVTGAAILGTFWSPCSISFVCHTRHAQIRGMIRCPSDGWLIFLVVPQWSQHKANTQVYMLSWQGSEGRVKEEKHGCVKGNTNIPIM